MIWTAAGSAELLFSGLELRPQQREASSKLHCAMVEAEAGGGAEGLGAGGSGSRRARKQNPLASRIKRLMQTDEDVGKIAAAAPGLIGTAALDEALLGAPCDAVAELLYWHRRPVCARTMRRQGSRNTSQKNAGSIIVSAAAGKALELFLGRLCSGAAAVAEQHHTKLLAPGHL